MHSIRKKAFRITTDSNHNYAVSPNLLKRDFTADKQNQKWVGDITYIPTDEGWLYAVIVKDLCLKKIVGYSFSSRIDTSLTVSALEMAVSRQKPQDNLIFHSDRGVQYASAGYREALSKHHMTQCMSRKGDPYDKAVSSFRRNIMSAEAHCQVNRGINAAIFRKPKKYCDSFRF